jgi:4-hydroxy-3-polyprenylbenzoate decarboxylase
MSTFIVGMSGASGAIYGFELLRQLLGQKHRIYVSFTREAQFIFKDEIGADWSGSTSRIQQTLTQTFPGADIQFYGQDDMTAPIASGSVLTDGMVVIPCSMKTVSAIANGLSSNLIERAADVTLKEGRPLIVVPRETPLSEIHLRNLLALAQMRVKVLPAMPAFYNHPKSIEDLVHFIVGRVLDSLKVPNTIYRRWKEEEKGEG